MKNETKISWFKTFFHREQPVTSSITKMLFFLLWSFHFKTLQCCFFLIITCYDMKNAPTTTPNPLDIVRHSRLPPPLPSRFWIGLYTTRPLWVWALHRLLTNTPPVYIWMLSLGISRGFAFVDFYHLQDATRWMETNQVASQSPSLVLILEIEAKLPQRQPKCFEPKRFLCPLCEFLFFSPGWYRILYCNTSTMLQISLDSWGLF